MTARTDTPAPATPPARVRRRLDRLATEIFAPWVWVLGLPLAIAWQATHHKIGATLLWGLIVGITGSVIPMIVIVRGAKQGTYDSHHITNREGRLVPFIVCLASVAGGFLALVLTNAPHQMLALSISMFATLVGALIITFGFNWKISIHAAVSSGAAIMLTLDYGPWLWLTWLAVACVNWSRVELKDHTTGQVTAGTALGVILGGLTYWLLATMMGA